MSLRDRPDQCLGALPAALDQLGHGGGGGVHGPAAARGGEPGREAEGRERLEGVIELCRGPAGERTDAFRCPVGVGQRQGVEFLRPGAQKVVVGHCPHPQCFTSPPASIRLRGGARVWTLRGPSGPMCPHRAMSESGTRKLQTSGLRSDRIQSAVRFLQTGVAPSVPQNPSSHLLDRSAMSSIRRNVIRAVVGVVAAVSLGLIGAATASAQPVPGDLTWAVANDLTW